MRGCLTEAEAELAALEDLRLSRAMGYISISPSTVGESFNQPWQKTNIEKPTDESAGKDSNKKECVITTRGS